MINCSGTESGIGDSARNYIQWGLCPIPTVKDEKRPVGNWKEYQDRFPTEAEWEQWETEEPSAFGIVCGRISGNLLVIDFDKQGEAFAGFKTKVPVILWRRLVIEQSPSGGYHIYVRSEQPVKTERLAEYQDTDGKWKPLIETRGEGGFCVCCPSPGYRLIQGDFNNIPVLQPEKVELLLNAARRFDRKPKAETGSSGTPKHIHLQQARKIVREAQAQTENRIHPVSFSFDQVKARADGKWNRVLECLCPNMAVVAPKGGRYETCPVCGKKWKFRFFNDFNTSGTCICYSCHEKGGDGIATVAWLLDCSPNEARDLLSDLLQTDLIK